MRNKKNKLLIILIILSINIKESRAQKFSDYIKANAISYKRNTKLNTDIYNTLIPYNLIMVGELHGTKEPANFVKGLAKLFYKRGDSIMVGIEIPPDMMRLYIKNRRMKNIQKSIFFSNKSSDGRANSEWLNLLEHLHNKDIKIFFFDINSKDWKNSAEKRDSLMYLNIKRKIEEYPHYRVVTLSGNIHSRLATFRNKKTTAMYLSEDSYINDNFKICTLNHKYAKGEMKNNTGNGIITKKLNSENSIFAKATNKNNYLLLINNYSYKYSGIFFTKRITASK